MRYWLSSGRKASEVAPELGVSDWSLNRWRKGMKGVEASSASASAAQSQLNALELAKENGSAQGAPGDVRMRRCLANGTF